MSEIKLDNNNNNKEKKEESENKSQENKSESQNENDNLNIVSSSFLLKKGDYSVHILIEEIKNLISISPNRLPKPCIKITCLNKTKRTSKPAEDCDSYTFNEHIYFDATDLSVEILDSSKIVLEVYDYHNSKREDYFGIQEFDFAYIYSKQNHCIKNIWIALANPEAKDITKINGYLKLSISVLSTEDEKVSLSPDLNSNNDCMIPPQIKTTYKQIKIFIYKGEEFPDMDNVVGKERKTKRRCNGFIECKYLGITKSTKVVDMENERIIWNQIIEIPITLPIISEKMVFFVKDKNKVYKDSIVGSFEISINDILKNKYQNLTCINLYGSILANDTTKNGNLMNTNAEIGSRWKGRVFLSISYEDTDNPQACVKNIDDKEQLDKINNQARGKLWSVYIKLFSIYYLPSEDRKYSVEIDIQEKTQSFPAKEAYKRAIEWNLCSTFTVQTVSNNYEELPDLMIYLINNLDQKICFQRVQLKHFHLNDDDMIMIKLFPEPCVNQVNALYLSGIAKMRIKVFNREIDPPNSFDIGAFKDGDESGRKELTGINNILMGGGDNNEEDLEMLLHDNNQNQNQNPDSQGSGGGINQLKKKDEFQFYTIVACVYMSRYLISGDSSGLSDPYVELSIDGNVQKTPVIKKCINGIWNETLIFDNIFFNYNDKSSWPIMLVKVLDKDLASSDLLGYSYIWLSDENYSFNNPKNIKPKWLQLYLEKSNRAQGQILLSFYIFDKDHQKNISQIQINPETVTYSVEMNILGLRELKPLNFIKIKKPYISFDLNSINVSNKNGESLQPIKTLPNEAGANPNINTVIKFFVKLPKDEIYIPEFQCDVYDQVLGGLTNKLLGIFLLNLKQIISETERHYSEEYKETKRILDTVRNFHQRGSHKNNIQLKSDSINNNNNEQTSHDKNKNKILETNNNNDIALDGEKSQDVLLKSITDNNYNFNLDLFNENKNDCLYACNSPLDLNKIYKGKIDNELLRTHKNDSNYFVIKPSFTTISLPKKIVKKTQNQNQKNNNSTNNTKNKNNKNNNNVTSEDYLEVSDHLIENSSNIPDKELYFPIGFNKNENPIHFTELPNIDYKINLNVSNKFEQKSEEENDYEKNKKNIINQMNKKHYRRIFGKELENVKELDLGSPFIKCHLIRNKFQDIESNINDLFEGMKNINNKIIKRFKTPKKELSTKLRGGINNLKMNYLESEREILKNKALSFDLKDYGYFKGLIHISSKENFDKHELFVQNIKNKFGGQLPLELSFLSAFDDLGKSVLIKRFVIIRVYLLEFTNLPSKDLLSESDPYVKIKLGEKIVVDEKKKYYENKKNCKWYQYYDILAELPGSSKLTIQIIDHNDIFSDVLIGETSIDIEDRYFDHNWQELENKPIEIRSLYHPDEEQAQGEISLWLEIFDKDKKDKMIPWNISPQPNNKLECRLIVYETEGMENLDIEDTSDIYVAAYINPKEKKATDVHYRCQNGHASFNWRLKIPIELPRENFDLTIQVFDNDFFSRDDYICGCRLNLINLINDANVLDLPIKLTKDFYLSLPKEKQNLGNIEFLDKDEDEQGVKFWVKTTKNGKKGGSVMCSLEIVPEWYAENFPVGKGRDSPNVDPYLPPPVGRIAFSLNPYKWLTMYTGPKFRKKCCCIICTILCVIYLIFLVPYFIYFIFGEIINPFNYTKKNNDNDKKKK